MSANTLTIFLNYFNQFEECVAGQRPWEDLAALFTDDATYSVRGVPFECVVEGPHAIAAAFQHSVTNFDKKMDSRGLEILSSMRESAHSVRLQLASSYGIEGVGVVVAPVSMVVSTENGKISAMEDLYDMDLTGPALLWIAEHGGDADPSYV